MLLEHPLIYICASKKDREQVARIYSEFKKRKFEVFWDIVDVKPGRNVRRERDRKFETSGLFLFVWSENFKKEGGQLIDIAAKAFKKQAKELSDDAKQSFRYVFPYVLDEQPFDELFDDQSGKLPIEAYLYDQEDEAISILCDAFAEEFSQRKPIVEKIAFKREGEIQKKKIAAIRELKDKIQQGEFDPALANEIIRLCGSTTHIDHGVLFSITFDLIKIEVYIVLKLIESVMVLDISIGKNMLIIYLDQIEETFKDSPQQMRIKFELSHA